MFSGGSSVGDRDLVLDLIARRGTVLFHGIAVKPGKPTALAVIGGKPFFGMPGYPTSCLSNAYVLLVPALRRMARLPVHAPRTVTLPLARRIVSSTGRHQFYTVRVVNGEAEPAFKASGDITSMSQADGYIEIPAADRHRGAGRPGRGEAVLVVRRTLHDNRDALAAGQGPIVGQGAQDVGAGLLELHAGRDLSISRQRRREPNRRPGRVRSGTRILPGLDLRLLELRRAGAAVARTTTGGARGSSRP